MNYSKSLSEFLLLLEGNYLKEARQLIIEILMDFANKMYNPEDIYELTGILCDMAREKAKGNLQAFLLWRRSPTGRKRWDDDKAENPQI